MKSAFSSLPLRLTAYLALSALSIPAIAQAQPYGASSKAGFEISRMDIAARGPNGIAINELSALAWDSDDKLLYALSDRGNLFHFRLRVKKNDIVSLEAVHAIPLNIVPPTLAEESKAKKSASRKSDSEPRADTEGLTLLNADNGIRGDAVLVVVTESGQSFFHLSPAGNLLQKTSLPAPLNDAASYQSSNKGLESVAYHPRYGLMTGPEVPLAGAGENRHTIYSDRLQWAFPRYSEEARLKAIDVLADGNLMVLERTKDPTSKLLTSTLSYVDLRNCTPGKTCKTTEKALLPEGEDNFEGLTRLGDRQFLLVSDYEGDDSKGGTLILATLR